LAEEVPIFLSRFGNEMVEEDRKDAEFSAFLDQYFENYWSKWSRKDLIFLGHTAILGRGGPRGLGSQKMNHDQDVII
jgi:hypothetical protein